MQQEPAFHLQLAAQDLRQAASAGSGQRADEMRLVPGRMPGVEGGQQAQADRRRQQHRADPPQVQPTSFPDQSVTPNAVPAEGTAPTFAPKIPIAHDNAKKRIRRPELCTVGT